MSYKEYLESPEWAELRAAVIERDKTCVMCNASRGLQVHHRTYANVGCESLGDLTALCVACHCNYTAAARVMAPEKGDWKDEIEGYRPATKEEVAVITAELRRDLGWPDKGGKE